MGVFMYCNYCFESLADTYPKVINSLTLIDHIPSMSAVILLKHPHTMYIDSLRTITRRVNTVLDHLDQNGDTNNDLLNDKVDNMLDSFMEHYDDILNILRLLVEISSNKKKFEKIKNKYVKQIKITRDHLGLIVNRIKHDQRKVSCFSIIGNNQKKYFGFFIEGVDENNFIVPDPEIHKNFKGMRTAFSFARELRLSLVNIFIVSAIVETFISEALGKLNIPTVPIKPNQFLKEFQDLIKRVSVFNNSFFIDEMVKDEPFISVTDSKVKIGISSKRVSALTIPSGRLNCQINVSEFNRSFGFIYWSGNKF